MSINFWEREREGDMDHKWGRGRETETQRHRDTETQNPKRAPGSEVSAQSPPRGSNSPAVRSWPEPKSDAQPTEPPRCPIYLISMLKRDGLLFAVSLNFAGNFYRSLISCLSFLSTLSTFLSLIFPGTIEVPCVTLFHTQGNPNLNLNNSFKVTLLISSYILIFWASAIDSSLHYYSMLSFEKSFRWVVFILLYPLFIISVFFFFGLGILP